MKQIIKSVSKYYPKVIKPWIERFLSFLIQQDDIKLIYVAGAISFNRVDKHSDIDIHCVVKNESGFRMWEKIDMFFEEDKQFIYRTNEKNYPWFGEMRTYYIKTPDIFYFDIGYVDEFKANEFYFQWNGIIVKDYKNVLKEMVALSLEKEAFKIGKILSFQLDQLFSAAIKINKDISRKLYWNATENLMQLRRSFVFLFSYENYYQEKFPFIGRPERDIEKIWSIEDLEFLSTTIPNGTFESIEQAKNNLLNASSKLTCLKQNPSLNTAIATLYLST